MKNLIKISDQELVAAVLDNKTEAYGELYSRYYRKAFQKCLSIVKDNDQAFDLAEEAMLKALNSLKNFRGDASFSTWLYVIVHRHCLEFLRKKNRQRLLSLDSGKVTINIAEDDDDSDTRSEMEKIMLILIDKMPSSDKELLLLKYKEGHSIEELEQQLHLSPSAVKMRLKRSKDRLNALYSVAVTAGLGQAIAMML